MISSKASHASHQSRGFALISSIAAITLTMMLLGAFFLSQRSFLAASRHNDDRSACRDSLLAVSDYCRFRLEKEPNWSVSPPLEPVAPVEVLDQYSRPVLTFDHLTQGEYNALPELHDLAGQTHILCTMPDNAVDLHLAVSNYLSGPDAVSPDQVAQKSCRIRIEAKRGTATERVELVLRKVALFDSTVFASRDINIDAQDVTFNSGDPIRNQVRSLQSIHAPDKNRLHFRADEASPPSVKGTVWAQGEEAEGAAPLPDKGEIFLAGINSPLALQEAAQQTGALFFPNDPGRYNPPVIEKENIITPDDDEELASMVYNFSELAIPYVDPADGVEKVFKVQTMQRFKPLDDYSANAFGEQPTEPPIDFYFDPNSLPAGLDPADVRWPDPPGPPPPPGTPGVPGIEVSGPFTPDMGPTVDLKPLPPSPPGGPIVKWSPRVALPAGVELRVKVEGPEGAEGPADFQVLASAQCDPEILFDSGDGVTPGNGMLNADRHIILQGKINGSARLLAGKDIHLVPNDTEVVASIDDDVALFAGRDVKIAPRATADEDLMNQGGFFVFRGLVYAQRDFVFTSSKRGSVYQRKLDIEGALVARSGSVLISGETTALIRYNPDYLDNILEDDFIGANIQVEELSWRPI